MLNRYLRLYLINYLFYEKDLECTSLLAMPFRLQPMGIGVPPPLKVNISRHYYYVTYMEPLIYSALIKYKTRCDIAYIY